MDEYSFVGKDQNDLKDPAEGHEERDDDVEVIVKKEPFSRRQLAFQILLKGAMIVPDCTDEEPPF